MPKKSKKGIIKCDDHNLILRPKQNSCRFNQTVTVSFCNQPNQINKNKSKSINDIRCLECPAFNNDRNYATPTFVLLSQKNHYQEKGQKMKEQHEKKMIEYSDQKSQFHIPKPRSKNNYCSVCRQVYEDYLDHIKSQKHKKKINSSIFNRYIIEVSQRLNPKDKNSLNSNQNNITNADDDGQYIEPQVKKKIKTDLTDIQRCSLKLSTVQPSIHLNNNYQDIFPKCQQNCQVQSYSFLNMHQKLPQPLFPTQHTIPIQPPPPIPPPFNYTFNYNMNIYMNPYNQGYGYEPSMFTNNYLNSFPDIPPPHLYNKMFEMNQAYSPQINNRPIYPPYMNENYHNSLPSYFLPQSTYQYSNNKLLIKEEKREFPEQQQFYRKNLKEPQIIVIDDDSNREMLDFYKKK